MHPALGKKLCFLFLAYEILENIGIKYTQKNICIGENDLYPVC